MTMDDRLASRSMMMPLTEREKMRAEATAYIEKGEALLAAASRGTQFPPTVGGSGSDLSQIYSPAVHSSMMSSMHNNNNPSNTIQSMARSSSVFDGTSAASTSTSGLSTYLDRPFHNNGLSSPPHQPNAYTGMSMSMGMGMGGMGGSGAASMYGGGSTLQDMYSDADLISASDRNQLRLERLMIMRRREQSMMLNEERARAEALRLTSNMKAAAASVVTPGSELDTEQTLAALGNSMRKKSSPYIDTSGMADPPAYELSRRRTRGGVTVSLLFLFFSFFCKINAFLCFCSLCVYFRLLSRSLPLNSSISVSSNSLINIVKCRNPSPKSFIECFLKLRRMVMHL